jgi:hypothetical protein
MIQTTLIFLHRVTIFVNRNYNLNNYWNKAMQEIPLSQSDLLSVQVDPGKNNVLEDFSDIFLLIT